MRLGGKRVSFWAAVGLTAILANFAAELIADHLPDSGPFGAAKDVIRYAHRGPVKES